MIRTPSAPLLTLMIGTGFQHEFQRLLLGHAADKRSIDLDCNNIFQDVKSIVPSLCIYLVCLMQRLGEEKEWILAAGNRKWLFDSLFFM